MHVLVHMVVVSPPLLYTERLARLAEVEAKWEEKKEALDSELEKLERTLANTFDK